MAQIGLHLMLLRVVQAVLTCESDEIIPVGEVAEVKQLSLGRGRHITHTIRRYRGRPRARHGSYMLYTGLRFLALPFA